MSTVAQYRGHRITRPEAHRGYLVDGHKERFPALWRAMAEADKCANAGGCDAGPLPAPTPDEALFARFGS
jgi:hypothetical protein